MPEYPLLSEAGLFIVHVRLSGPRASRFVRLALDTGATITMIPPKAALAIGVNPARATTFREILTASGKEYIPLAVIHGVRVFEVTLRNVRVACHELPVESPIDGLLGLDLLKRLRAVLDLGKASITIP